jgi:Flp pilus assembly pilin Flp
MLNFLETRNDRGATGVEYAIMASLVAAVIIGTVFLLGQAVLGLFQQLPPSAFGG